MEYALVFGLAVPVMLPMLVIVLAVQCAVLHFAKEHFLLRVIHNHRPPLSYLWFSAVLGYALGQRPARHGARGVGPADVGSVHALV